MPRKKPGPSKPQHPCDRCGSYRGVWLYYTGKTTLSGPLLKALCKDCRPTPIQQASQNPNTTNPATDAILAAWYGSQQGALELHGGRPLVP